MRIFTYRNKHRMKRAALLLCFILLAIVVVFFCLFQYLQRYLVYTENGVQLQFPGATQPSDPVPEVSGEYVVGDPVQAPVSGKIDQLPTTEQTLNPISGFFITYDMLLDPDAVQAALEEVPDGSAVLLDLKSIYGNFYYSSTISGTSNAATIDTAAVDSLIQTLQQRDLYRIARIPAFRDNAFALAHQSEGLPLSSGALWMDTDGCYWLNPSSTQVQDYLKQICLELNALGFDEVVLSDFYFPQSANIVFTGERSRRETVTASAQALLDALSDHQITLSFDLTNCTEDYPLVAEKIRRYFPLSDGSAVQATVSLYGADLTDSTAQLVFLTNSRDTRFTKYSYLRPLIP